MANYIVKNINEVTERINNGIKMWETKLGRKVEFSEYAAREMDSIYQRSVWVGKVSREDQHLISAILGSMLHQDYCDSRRLDKPNENGLINNPREKKLTEPLDAEFVQDVLDGRIPQSPTLYVRDGKVFMDIANTEFIKLSPFWKKDNFMAGKAAIGSILTCWEGLAHKNPEVKKYVEIAVASGIHESWRARGNVYYDEYEGDVFTNEELDIAFSDLSDEEKAKDVSHIGMAYRLMQRICSELSKIKKNNQAKTENQSSVDEGQPS